MKIWYYETEGTMNIDESKAKTAPVGRWGEKREKINEPMIITMQVEIDKKKYEKLKTKYKTSLQKRIFSYFGFN